MPTERLMNPSYNLRAPCETFRGQLGGLGEKLFR